MDIKCKDGVLTITIPCGPEVIKAAGLTKSEKNKAVAGTGGFIPVQGTNFKLNLSLVAPK
jgi:hypothetical protein